MYLTKEKADKWCENVPDDGAFILAEQSDELGIYFGGKAENVIKLLAYTIKSISLSCDIAISDIYESLEKCYEEIKASGQYAESQDGYVYDLSNDFGVNSETDMMKLPPIPEESKNAMESFIKDTSKKFEQIEPLISEAEGMSEFNKLIKDMYILPNDDGNPCCMRFELEEFSFAYDIRYPDSVTIITDGGVGEQFFENHGFFYEYVKDFFESIRDQYKEEYGDK